MEAAGRKGGGCMWGCRDWRYSMYREVENGGAGTRLGSQQNFLRLEEIFFLKITIQSNEDSGAECGNRESSLP